MKTTPMLTVDVAIPTYGPDEKLHKLLTKLKEQTVLPEKILVINTDEKRLQSGLIPDWDRITVMHISKEEFDHGGTRDRAASLLPGDIILFLTQDAVPVDNRLVEQLCMAFSREDVAAAYARQLPDEDCGAIEAYTRAFNYPPQSRIKTAADLPGLGVKTFFCSNVCAAYRRRDYEQAGGFLHRTIFNEDMILAGRLIQLGKAVAYCAEAQVIHSHNYSGIYQLHRNFDLAVSQADNPDIFGGIRSEGEGIRMVKATAGYLVSHGKIGLLPKLVWQSGMKYLGYFLGKRYQKLPKKVVLALTMNRSYWR